jgi:hypothetical protein
MFAPLVTLLLLGDIGPAPLKVKPARPPAECQSDNECVLSTFSDCCGSCCQADPHAVRKGVNEAAKCAVIDCMQPNCAAVKCAQPRPTTDFVAACESGRCVARPKNAPAPQCRSDNECVVIEKSPPGRCEPCGCCPNNVAVPAHEAVKLGRRDEPEPPPPPGQKPSVPFGLSTGSKTPPGPPPPQPNCSPCPSPGPASAACRGGRCVLEWTVPRPPPPG